MTTPDASTASQSATLADDLTNASAEGKRWMKRDALPLVFVEYKLFMESGRYPYTVDVVKDIALKYGLSADPKQRFDHQAVNDANDTVLIQLHTEVYLASTQYRVLEMQAQERELSGQGFAPITQLVPEAGMKIQLPDGKTYRLVQAGKDWALLGPGKRTHGISLNGLVQQQAAYEKAVARGRTAHDDPHVRGCKLAEVKTAKRSTIAAAAAEPAPTTVETPSPQPADTASQDQVEPKTASDFGLW